MYIRTTLLGISVGLALTMVSMAAELPASADTVSASRQSVIKAADWVSEDFTDNCVNGNSSGYDCSSGGLADAIMALSAANDPKYSATLAQMNVQL